MKANSEKKRPEGSSKLSNTRSLETKADREVKEKNLTTEMDTRDDKTYVGQFELNELMTHVLEEELKSLMIEVWQAIPDDPPTDIERYVADKLRIEVSDVLCNVLGLNVTKRLLNVNNPLFVKLRFSCRPESGCLTKFLNTYNIRSFKRINKEKNTFAARVSSITDFDNICASKEIRCGGAKITIIPCYKFTQCPKRLNTKFADKFDEEKPNNDSKDPNNDESLKTEEKALTTENETDEKAKHTADKKPDTQNSKTNTVRKDDKPKEIPKPTPAVELIKATIEPKNLNNEPVGEPKKATIEAKNELVVGPKKIDPTNLKKEVVDPKNTIERKINKSPITKLQKTIIKNGTKAKTLKPTQKQNEKLITAKTEKSKKADSKKDLNDFNDEMNDEEILALISSGIVVDECSGSDNE